MNLDDRARLAAEDLASKAAAAAMPPVPGQRRRVLPIWAVATGAVVVLALVLAPLLLLGGPRDPEEPSATAPSTVVPTEVPPTQDPQGATSTTQAPAAETTVVIDDLAAMVPSAPTIATVASFPWGDGDEAVGRDESGAGPCCFDVATDGTVVLLDRARLRLLAVDPTGAIGTIAPWEAGDFVPSSMVIHGAPQEDVVFVLGRTNRPGRPTDLITMALDGTVIERAETITSDEVEMVVSAGSVWAGEWESGQVRWIQLATSVGDIIDLEVQEWTDSLWLSDRGRLSVEAPPRQPGVIVTHVSPEGAGTIFEVDIGGTAQDHWIVPTRDGLFVTAATSEVASDGSLGRVAVLLDPAGNVVDGVTWAGSQWADVGPHGLTQLGPDGAIYELSSTEAGVEVRRLALQEAAGFDAVRALAALGGAMTVNDGTMWIAGPLRGDNQRGDHAEILQVDSRPPHELLAVHEVPAPMNAVDVVDDAVWMARAGDGALPQNLVARLNIASGQLEVADLGDLSTNEIVATSDGAWILAWPGAGSAHLAFVSGEDLDVESLIPLPDGAEPLAMDMRNRTLWIASLDGRVFRYDTARASFLSAIDVGVAGFDILVVDDRDEAGGFSVWVTGLEGDVVRLASSGSIEAQHALDEGAMWLAGNAGSGAAWATTRDGALYFLSPDGEPLRFAEAPVADAAAIASDGARVWVLGDTLAVVELGQ